MVARWSASSGRVLVAFVLAAAAGCGGSAVDSAAAPGPAGEGAASAPTEPASAGGPSVPRRSPDEEYPAATEESGGVLRLAGNGCWYLDTAGEPSRMVVWPEGSELGSNGDAVEVPGTEPLVVGAVIAADVATVPAADLAGGPDGYWGYITGYCDEGGPDVALVEAPTLLLDPAAPPPLTVDHPCGYGFTASTEDQTVALLLWPTTMDGPPPGGEVDLAGADWMASLRVGRDLMAEWCDDVIEPGAPVPVTLAEWSLRAGLLEFDPGDGECGASVTATLQGLVVDAPVVIELPDTTVTNTAYGCFAG